MNPTYPTITNDYETTHNSLINSHKKPLIQMYNVLCEDLYETVELVVHKHYPHHINNLNS